jgi:Methyltransferase domain
VSRRPRLGSLARTAVRRAARRAGLDTVRADFYSPIVHPDALPAAVWEREAPMPGLELDLDAQLHMIEEQLMPLVDGFRPPPENPWYRPMDSHVLYAMVRRRRPARVLELGSGYSTLVIQQALEGGALHEVVDPDPSGLIPPAGVTVHRRSAATAPRELFDALGEHDILFVDTSHVIRPGGEVVRIVLEVLPTLARGVTVHFHDFFRPFEYPRVLYEELDVHWQEQYLLQAFLAFNEQFEVLCANHALWRLRRERVRRLFPDLREGMEPSALWLRRL